MGTMLLYIRAPIISLPRWHSVDVGNDTMQETVGMMRRGKDARLLAHHHLLLLRTAVNSWCSPKKTSKHSTVSISFFNLQRYAHKCRHRLMYNCNALYIIIVFYNTKTTPYNQLVKRYSFALQSVHLAICGKNGTEGSLLNSLEKERSL